MKILLIDESNLRLNHLREALQELPAIGFMEVPVAVYMMPPSGLDAVFMTLPAAEKWGRLQIEEGADSENFSGRSREWFSSTGCHGSEPDAE